MSLGESPCRSGSAHQTIGGVCAGRRFPGKHALFLISLTVLRLRAGRLRGHPPPRVSGIRGSDPPDRRAPIGTAAGWHVHSHATPRSGVAPAP